MALRLRRGTDLERQSVIFEEGELVYTTDTKILWIGDGQTLGGIKVTDGVNESPIALTRNLDLNGFDITGSGDIDISGVVVASSFVGDGSGLINLPVLDVVAGGNYNINIVGLDSSIIVNSETSSVHGNLHGSIYDSAGNMILDFASREVRGELVGSNFKTIFDSVTNSFYGGFIGNFDGDLTGNVLASDSTLLMDNVTGTFYGNFVGDGSGLINVISDGDTYQINILGANGDTILNSSTNSINVELINFTESLILDNTNTSLAKLVVVAHDNLSTIKLQRHQNGVVDDTMLYGRLDFEKHDTIGSLTKATLGADNGGIFLSYNQAGVDFTESTYVVLSKDSKLGVGTFTPSEKLDVRGNVKASGFVQFGNMTTTQRNALTPSNGMVIYNTTNNKFEGYQNGAWINLDSGLAAS